MKLLLIKPDGVQYDITNAVSRIEWGGSASAAARSLSIAYLNAPFDNYNLPAISTGDYVSFAPESEEVFYGQFHGSEKSAVIGTITFTAYDMMNNMLKSKGRYNFKNLPPETIAKMICDDAQIPIRYLYPTGINIESLICSDMTLYDCVMSAYTKAHKITGDKYFPMIYKRQFAVYRTEWIVKGFELSDNTNLSSVSINESMDDLVNRVRIYDDADNQIGEVSDNESLGLYGTYQEVYKAESGVDPTTGAKEKLNVKPKQTIRVSSAIGDMNCLSCYFVKVHDGTTGLDGKYWISSDRHVWENNCYTMDLDLEFESIMQTKEGSS